MLQDLPTPNCIEGRARDFGPWVCEGLEEYNSRYCDLIHWTVVWLRDEGYLREVTDECGAQRVPNDERLYVLTDKSLRALAEPIPGQKGNADKVTFGQKLVEAAKRRGQLIETAAWAAAGRAAESQLADLVKSFFRNLPT